MTEVKLDLNGVFVILVYSGKTSRMRVTHGKIMLYFMAYFEIYFMTLYVSIFPGFKLTILKETLKREKEKN